MVLSGNYFCVDDCDLAGAFVKRFGSVFCATLP